MADTRTSQQRRRDGAAMQAIEGNPLTAEEICMFEMFDQRGWSPEQRRAFIIDKARNRIAAVAAE